MNLSVIENDDLLINVFASIYQHIELNCEIELLRLLSRRMLISGNNIITRLNIQQVTYFCKNGWYF